MNDKHVDFVLTRNNVVIIGANCANNDLCERGGK